MIWEEILFLARIQDQYPVQKLQNLFGLLSPFQKKSYSGPLETFFIITKKKTPSIAWGYNHLLFTLPHEGSRNTQGESIAHFEK